MRKSNTLWSLETASLLISQTPWFPKETLQGLNKSKTWYQALYKWESLKGAVAHLRSSGLPKIRGGNRLKESKWSSWKICSEKKKKIPLAWKNSDDSAIPEHFLQTIELFSIFWRSAQYFRIKAVADRPSLRDICQEPGAEAAPDQPLYWLQLWHCCLWWEPGCQIDWSQATSGFMNTNTVKSLEADHESQVHSKAAVMPMSHH